MSQLEEALAFQLTAAGVTGWTREERFCDRRWRFDFCWPLDRLAVEVDGGVFSNGAHVRGTHYTSDCEKYNEAILLGWRVLRFTGQQVTDGYALDCIRRALGRQE